MIDAETLAQSYEQNSEKQQFNERVAEIVIRKQAKIETKRNKHLSDKDHSLKAVVLAKMRENPELNQFILSNDIGVYSQEYGVNKQLVFEQSHPNKA